MRFLRAVAAVAISFAGLSAQAIWTASSSNLQAVFQQAAPGDVVLLPGGGPYEPFQLTKGLTLIGVLSQTQIENQQGPTHDSSITVPAGQRARIVDLDFRQAAYGGGHHVQVNGDVAFEHCRFQPSSFGNPESVEILDGDVRMHHCEVLPSLWGASGLRAVQGLVSLTDCTLAGNRASWDPFLFTLQSASGLYIENATVVASRCTITGGAAGWDVSAQPYLPPAPGIRVTGSSGRLFLSDSAVTGGSGFTQYHPQNLMGPGAAAIAAGGAGVVEFARSALLGGPGTVVGPASTGNVVQVPELVGIGIDHGFVRGLTTTVTATAGSSQQLLGVVGGFDGTLGTNPIVVEPVLPATQVFVLVLATPPVGGVVPAAVAVPDVPGLLGVDVWLQALQWTNGAARASPVVGGVVR